MPTASRGQDISYHLKAIEHLDIGPDKSQRAYREQSKMFGGLLVILGVTL